MDYFLEEILSQPRILRATLDRYLEDKSLLRPVGKAIEQGNYQMLLLTGMGSSYFALYPACIYLNEHGLSAIMVEASELLHYYSKLVSDRVLVVIVSQSGETVEVKKLLAEIRGSTSIVSLTNDAENYLAGNSDIPLLLYGGQEIGPASKTHTTTILVSLLLAMYLTTTMNKHRVQRLYAAVEAIDSFFEQWGERSDALFDFLGDVDYLSLLGRGPSMASAMAGALILKEAAKMRAEGVSAGQFRHGPLEVVAPDFAAIVFAMKGRTRDINLWLAHDIAEFGGKVVIIGSDEELEGEKIFNLALPLLDEICSPLLEIVPIQLLSWRIAKEKGLPPGKFDKARKVTLYE